MTAPALRVLERLNRRRSYTQLPSKYLSGLILSPSHIFYRGCPGPYPRRGRQRAVDPAKMVKLLVGPAISGKEPVGRGFGQVASATEP